MAFSSLFRKKTVQDILKQIEKMKLMGMYHGRHLTARDLTAFGIAAIVGAGILVPLVASSDGGPAVIFLFLFTALAWFCCLCLCRVCVNGSRFRKCIHVFLCRLWGIMAWIIGWALIMEYAIGNITVAISWSDFYGTIGQWRNPLAAMGSNGLASTGYRDATALMQGGKQYENLSED
jgi:amino acid transporter